MEDVLVVTAPGFSWQGTYKKEDAESEGRPVYGGEAKLFFRRGMWIIHTSLSAPGQPLARQKDPKGPTTSPGVEPWKILEEDGKFHAPTQPVLVEPMKRSRGIRLVGESDARCAGASSSIPLIDGDLEVVEEAGMVEDVARMSAGAAVFRRVRIREGAAEGWEVEGRLEMDRHWNKETSRSTRWTFVQPGLKRSFHSLKGSNWSVSSCTSPAVTDHLTAVKEQLRKKLVIRRDGLLSVGKLIDQEKEGIWQQMLAQRDTFRNNPRIAQLRRLYAAETEKVSRTPEWRPPEFLAAARRNAAAAATDPVSSSGQPQGASSSDVIQAVSGGDPGTSYSSPPRPPEDAFLSHILSSMRSQQRGVEEEQPDHCEEEGEEARFTMADEEQPRDGEAGPPSAGGTLGGATDPATAPARKRRRTEAAASLRSLFSDLAAATACYEEAVALYGHLLTSSALDMEELQGLLKPAGSEDAAWSFIVAACRLERAGSKLAYACFSLLKASKRSLGSSLARLLAVQDALSEGEKPSFQKEAFREVALQELGPGASAGSSMLALHRLASELRRQKSRGKEPVLAAALRGAFACRNESSDLAQLAAFACCSHLRATGSSEFSSCLERCLLEHSTWAVWKRALALLFGLLLVPDRGAVKVLQHVLTRRAFPADAGDGRWELFILILSMSDKLVKELLDDPPTPKHLGPAAEWPPPQLSLWEAFLAHPGRELPRLLAGNCSPAHLLIAREVKDFVFQSAGSVECFRLSKLIGVWHKEADALESREHLGGDVDALDRMLEERAAICTEAMWYFSSPERIMHQRADLESAARAFGRTLALLLPRKAAICRRLMDHNLMGLPAEACWPPAGRRIRASTFSESADPRFRTAEESEGPSFSPTGKLAHLNGLRFAEILEDRPLVAWLVAQGVEQSAEAQAGKRAVNGEVNRFAEWVVEEVFVPESYLRIQKPAKEGAKLAEAGLKIASLRVEALSKGCLLPLLQRFASSAPLPGEMLWVRDCSLAAALQAASLHEAQLRQSASLEKVPLDLLGALAAGGTVQLPSESFWAALDVSAEVPEEPSKAWLFSGFARDTHALLQRLERLGRPFCDPRIDALMRLLAAASRRIQGQWPGPARSPPTELLSCAPKLRFDPLLLRRPPGTRKSNDVGEATFQRRPLAAALAYLPAPPEGLTTGFATLSAWSAALVGSDGEDYCALHHWRTKSLETLEKQDQRLHLQRLHAAIASRFCAIVCAIETSRTRRGSWEDVQRMERMLRVAAQDFESPGFRDALQHHADAVASLVFCTENIGEKRVDKELAVVSMRHLFFRYISAIKLTATLHSLRGEGWHRALPESLRCWLQSWHEWMQSGGSIHGAAALQQRAAAVPAPPLDEMRWRGLAPEEVAPLSISPCGCFAVGVALDGADVEQLLAAILERGEQSALAAL